MAAAVSASARDRTVGLGRVRGASLYIGALMGPGLLLVPALAVRAAGAASIVAWGALLLLSAPLAVTFAALGVRHPVSGGVAAYVAEGLGGAASAVTGGWFVSAVLIGAPAVSLIGGLYVADLTGFGTPVAAIVALGMLAFVIGANAIGLHVSSALQLTLSCVLIALVAVAVGVALPARAGEHWTPFAPHGWWAVGTAANILIWLFVGWEAGAQLAGEFRSPGRDLPRAIGLAFAAVTVLYVGLAVATIGVTSGSGSDVPLADLVAVGFGSWGRDATAVIAVALTMGTMNVYVGGAAKLAAALAEAGALPAWLGADGVRSVPRRPLIPLACVGTVLLVALAAGAAGPDALIRATSACFIAVYLLALLSAVRILDGVARAAALMALACMVVVAGFSAAYLLVPAATAVASLAVRRSIARRRARLTHRVTAVEQSDHEVGSMGAPVIATNEGGPD
jgi:amino acid efflux transporter